MQHFNFPTHIFGITKEEVLFEPGIALQQSQPLVGMSTGYIQPDQPDFISTLGTPVYGSLTLGDTDKASNPNNEYSGLDGKIYLFETMTLPQVVMLVQGKKNIIKTRIPYYPHGSFKEYIGMDDYDITIHCNIDKPAGVAPKNELSRIREIYKANAPIPVTSYYLNQLGIYQVVIEDISLPQEKGRYSSQAFTIRAISHFKQQ